MFYIFDFDCAVIQIKTDYLLLGNVDLVVVAVDFSSSFCSSCLVFVDIYVVVVIFFFIFFSPVLIGFFYVIRKYLFVKFVVDLPAEVREAAAGLPERDR